MQPLSRSIAALVAFAVVALAPVAALAQDAAGAASEGFWSAFWTHVIPVLGALVMAAASLALKALRDRYQLSVDVGADAFLRARLRSVVLGVEEWAAARFKVGEPKPAAAEKLAEAMKIAGRLYPKLGESELAQLITEELARTPGVGATGGGA